MGERLYAEGSEPSLAHSSHIKFKDAVCADFNQALLEFVLDLLGSAGSCRVQQV